MSGTSIDGVDLVYANCFHDKSSWSFKILRSKTYEYDIGLAGYFKKPSQIKIIDSIKLIDINYTILLSEYIFLSLLENSQFKQIDFISSHGHTALHDPSNSYNLSDR